MKKLYSILFFLLITAFVSAQAPQGINYQAIALNGLGIPVSNQLIGVRLSILDQSATGTVIYQETHNPLTDATGLFSLVIGNGAVVSGTFSGINWGNGTKWLKSEIDITGGTSYVLMGSSQFMSVPYALYANKVKPVSVSFQHPDGLDNITPVQLYDSIPYTVPAGKNLIMNHVYYTIIDNFILIDGLLTTAAKMYNMPGASAGSVVKFSGNGFLVDKIVDWKTIDIAQTAFVVPAGKIFVVVCQREHMRNVCAPTLNGTIIKRESAVLTNSVFDEGSILSVTGSGCAANNSFVLNGYLRDK